MTYGEKPGVVWVTGLSRSGKSTVAGILQDKYVRAGIRPILLDGETIRQMIVETPSYSLEERRKLASLYGKLAQEFVRQGHLVICATISLFREVHIWNRDNLPNYFEVWLRVPMEELRRRDYGRLYNVDPVMRGPLAGIELAVDFPAAPDLVIDNFGEITPACAAGMIMKQISKGS